MRRAEAFASRDWAAQTALPETPSLQEAARLYARTRSPRVRVEVVRRCSEWATALARGVARRSSAEPDDLAQVALLALVRALERFDPAVGEFEPYARATVAGEVRHYLRSTEWPLHVARRYQDAYRQLARAREQVGPSATSADGTRRLAAEAGVSTEELDAVLVLQRRTQSLDGPAHGAENARWLANDDARLESVPERADLGAALRNLRPAERELLHMYFVQDVTQREMAQALGTSQVRISRLLSRTLATLRLQLEA